MTVLPTDLPRLQRRNLSEEVASTVRGAILTGQYRPGERLVVEQLASRLGISATPVREGLLALANEGLIETESGRGFRTLPLRRRDVEDSFRINGYLTGLLAEAAAMLITPEAIGALRHLHRGIEEAAAADHQREATVAALNRQFHRSINQISDSPRLRWFLRAADRFVPTRYYMDVPGWIDASVREHPAIVDALEARDTAGARELSQAHVVNAGNLVIARLDEIDLWHE